MIRNKGILLLLLLMGAWRINAQDVRVSGKVLDGYTQRPISSVSVISSKQNVSYLTDDAGFFSFSCEKNDTLFLFFPGYRTVRFSAADSALKSSYFFTFYYAPLSATTSNPVIIRPKKTLEQIGQERKELGSVPKEYAKPDFASEVMSPVTLLYDLLSSRAKEKKKLRGQYVEDERRRVYKELFDYFKEKKLIDLPEDRYDEFIDYMNLPLSFLQQSSDYEITETIVRNYKRFGVSRGFVK
ncbi:MAG TPA: hypothetical protein VGB95_00540 [Chitinophagales bacterium]